jgi:hypothetical protein
MVAVPADRESFSKFMGIVLTVDNAISDESSKTERPCVSAS